MIIHIRECLTRADPVEATLLHAGLMDPLVDAHDDNSLAVVRGYDLTGC